MARMDTLMPSSPLPLTAAIAGLFLAGLMPTFGQNAHGISVDQYKSIQEAIDANPGKMIYVPSGDYSISSPLTINTENTGLFGPGRIIQNDPKAIILLITNAIGVRLQDITLTRAEGTQECHAQGIMAKESPGLELDNVRVIDNRNRSRQHHRARLRSLPDSRLPHPELHVAFH